MKSRTSGFTLIELVITMAILGVMLVWAIPNVIDFIRNARMQGITSDLVGDITLARQEAQRRGQIVTVCASANGTSCDAGTPDWMAGRIILAPNAATPLLKTNLLPDGAIATKKITGVGTAVITFAQSGAVISGGGVLATIRLRDVRAGAGDLTQRDVTVSLVGRPLVVKVTG